MAAVILWNTVYLGRAVDEQSLIDIRLACRRANNVSGIAITNLQRRTARLQKNRIVGESFTDDIQQSTLLISKSAEKSLLKKTS